MADGTNTDGTADGTHRFTFHRFLGDFNGDLAVTNTDLSLFNFHYRSKAGQPAYDFAFDLDGNGDINATDLLNLRKRLGTSLP